MTFPVPRRGPWACCLLMSARMLFDLMYRQAECFAEKAVWGSNLPLSSLQIPQVGFRKDTGCSNAYGGSQKPLPMHSLLGQEAV